ncbi:MAG: hypothetical protein H6Q81_2628, partial [Deltaproteobacteria bacterium]|nr:hypothetical protein [Deltaproteobacteria bacterium]
RHRRNGPFGGSMTRRIVKMAISLVVCLLDGIRRVSGRLTGSRAPGRGIVLYYHSVPDSERRRFARQMDRVARRSRPVALEGMRRMEEGRYVLVTFDDGFECVARNAFLQAAWVATRTGSREPDTAMSGRGFWMRKVSGICRRIH